MYAPSGGTELTEQAAKELDDTYLASDPYEYFRARIASLAALADGAPWEASRSEGGVTAKVEELLQRPVVSPQISNPGLSAYVAAEALTLRHHAAEALCRLALVALQPAKVQCVWAALVDGPRQIPELLERLESLGAHDDAGAALWWATVPVCMHEEMPEGAGVEAVNVFGSWIGFAASSLQSGELDFQVAHNKVKHGMAVRARADVRMTLTSVPPSPKGEVPLSAFAPRKSTDLLRGPVLEFLCRTPSNLGRALELTQLALDPAQLLAESTMIAWTHGALFAVLAHKHFGCSHAADNSRPAHPGFPFGGPTPANLRVGDVSGARFPITEPLSGTPARPCVIVHQGDVREAQVRWDRSQRGRVVSE